MAEGDKDKAGLPTERELESEIVDILAQKGLFTPEETSAIAKLSTQQKLYAKLRPICRTAVEAVKRAGYSKKSAKWQAQYHRKSLGIQALIRYYEETADISPGDMIELKGDPKEILTRNVNKVLAKLLAQVMDPVGKPKDVISACEKWLHMAGLKPTEHFTVESRHPELAKLTTDELKKRAAELVEDIRSRMPVVVLKKEAG